MVLKDDSYTNPNSQAALKAGYALKLINNFLDDKISPVICRWGCFLFSTNGDV